MRAAPPTRTDLQTPPLGAELEVVVEVPRFGLVKWELHGGRRRLGYISPFPCPFNYGFVPDTLAPDGDPLDAVVLGARRRSGTRIRGVLVAALDFVDDGTPDPKLVLCPDGYTLQHRDRKDVLTFFRFYAYARALLNRLKGKRGPCRCEGIRWASPARQETLGA